jgi:HK97 gp10 family phage protein
VSKDSYVAGGAALDALLQTLPNTLETKVMRAALHAGAEVYLAEVRNNIPVASGKLRDTARITMPGGQKVAEAVVRVGSKAVNYAQMVEFGTRPHMIYAKPGHALRIGGAEVQSVSHPGARPRPYMRLAADAKFTEAMAAVQDKMREQITENVIGAPARAIAAWATE